MKGIIAYALSKKYTNDSMAGAGAVKGVPCQIKSTTEIDGGNRITFLWVDNNNDEHEDTLDVKNGLGIKSVAIVDGHLIVTYDDDTEEDAGVIPGGGDAELTSNLKTAISVGGIDSGVTYPEGTPLEDILRDMLEPTLYPTLTAPSASISYAASQYYAVGATVPAMAATVSFSRGSINPAYGTNGYRSGEATLYVLATSGADTEYNGQNADGNFSIPALTRATKGNITLSCTVSYLAGTQPKDSKGNDYSTPLPAGSVNANKTFSFIQPYYYGVSNTSSISDFTGLTENVSTKGQKTFNYTTNNQYMVIAYDASYGNIKTILDGNGFDVTGGWTKGTLTVDGFSYFVYISNSPTTDTNAPFTFKY